ncbi:Uncharacterised protein [Bordetella pertussis]|nr:Uncharacterised protein [Bordetella pertussis]CPQ79312.1 Uncharacterised protein [Bordetella pertussis]
MVAAEASVPSEISTATMRPSPPMRMASTYAAEAVGRAENSTSMRVSSAGSPSAQAMPSAADGMAASLTASIQPISRPWPLPPSQARLAPTHMMPSARAAAPSRAITVSMGPGRLSPARLQARLSRVETSSGLRASSRSRPLPLWRARPYTAATLAMGTAKPTISAMMVWPGPPARLAARARPI